MPHENEPSSSSPSGLSSGCGVSDGDDQSDVLTCSESERAATDSQLLRIGRRIGLRYHEAEALLEILEEELADVPQQPPPAPASPHHVQGPPKAPKPPKALHVALRGYRPSLLTQLRAIPGLFLLTDGVTASRVERALHRVRGVMDASARITRFLAEAEVAAGSEAHLLERVTRALVQGVRSGRLRGQGQPQLMDLLEPLIQAYERRYSRQRRKNEDPPLPH